MNRIETNIEILRQHLVTILKQGESYCITITTMGNLLYILNDGNTLYVLLVPNKKLTRQLSLQILQINGWTEKHSLTNYHKTFDLYSMDIIVSEVDRIFTEIMRIPKTREWRFEINSRMIVVKANEIAIDATTRRRINNVRANSPLRQFFKFLMYPFSTNQNMSISVTILIAVLILIKEKSMNSILNYKSVFLITGIGLFSYIVLQFKYPDKK